MGMIFAASLKPDDHIALAAVRAEGKPRGWRRRLEERKSPKTRETIEKE
jgi:hypothetical protein